MMMETPYGVTYITENLISASLKLTIINNQSSSLTTEARVMLSILKTFAVSEM